MRCARRLSSVVFRASKTLQLHAVATTHQTDWATRLKIDYGTPILNFATANFQPEKCSAESNIYLPAVATKFGSTFGPIRTPTCFISPTNTEFVQPKNNPPNSASIGHAQAARLRLSILVSPQLATWQHLLHYTTPAGSSSDISVTHHCRDSPLADPETNSAHEAGVVSNRSRNDVFNWPNAVSVARLLSGPPIAL